MIKRTYIDDESGIALVIALVVLLALTVMGISSMTTSTLDVRMSGNERRTAEALNFADAGIERGLQDLLYDYKNDPLASWANNTLYMINVTTANGYSRALSGTAFGEFSTGEPGNDEWGDPFTDNGNISGGIGNSVDVYGVQTLGDGKFRVLLLRDASEPDEAYIRSYAEHSTGARKIVQLHIDMKKIDAWRNAVFSGRGSATASINGNINVAGSVHVLGTGDTNNWTVSGNASVVNGYHNLAAGTKARLLGLEVVGTYLGNPVYSLESEFRVKNVQVGITGSGNIGEQGGLGALPDGIMQGPDGTYYKSTVDAIYANKEITGADDGIFSDKTVMPGGYDLGDKIQMPSLEDAYDPSSQKDLNGNPMDPATCAVPNECNYKDYVTTLSVELDAANDLSTPCALQPGVTADFQVGAMNCTDPDDLNTCTCTDANGCLKWDSDGGGGVNLFTAGRVEITGSCGTGFTIADGAPVTYTGKGIIYTANKVTIDSSFVTPAGRKFIQDDLIALMTESNMSLAPNAQETYMGAFFAAGLIGTDKNSDIIGALVSNLFCMGTGLTGDDPPLDPCGNGGNAADIYYTPGLSDELAKMGMLKGKMVYTFGDYEWEEKF